MTQTNPIVTRHKVTALRSMSKENLVNIIVSHYQEFNNILEALSYIRSDIDLIEKGEAWHVHDNP